MPDDADTPPAGGPGPGAPPIPGPGPSVPGGPSAGGPGGAPPAGLPPQGAAVPMPVRAAGNHAQGMSIMTAALKAIRMAIPLLGDSKEGSLAAEILVKGHNVFSVAEGSKDEAVDPVNRVTQAIMARRMQQRAPAGPPGAPPGGPGGPPPAMAPRGPIPAGPGAPPMGGAMPPP